MAQSPGQLVFGVAQRWGCHLGFINMSDSPKPKQKTERGLEIPVPTKGDFDEAMEKVAPPAGRKRPADSDQPQKRSE
jgi:hypothetical protein